MRKAFKQRGILVLIAVIMLISSIPAIGEGVNNLDNNVRTTIDKLNLYSPSEVEGVEPDKIPLQSYIRYARYLNEIEGFNKTVAEHQSELSDIVLNSNEVHNNMAKEYQKVFGVKSNDPKEVLLQVIEKSEEHIKVAMDMLTGEEEEDEEEEKDVEIKAGATDIFKKNFSILKSSLKHWSDSIRYLKEWGKVDEDTAQEMQADFEREFETISKISRALKLDLNLTFIRPEEEYNQSASVGHIISDDDGNLIANYMEIFALSAHAEFNTLDELEYKLSKGAKDMYRMWRDKRVPLMKSNASEPINDLYSRGSKKNLKMSNLGMFFDNVDGQEVLFLPVYLPSEEQQLDKTKEKLEEEDKGEKANLKEEELSYRPVYIKGPKTAFAGGKAKLANMLDKGEIELPENSAVLMNYMQLTNAYQSGKFNDLRDDAYYPLFMDMWGNIQTYSGKIVIPGVSNNTFMKENEYFPLNAYFINNYPVESSQQADISRFGGNKNKYVITALKLPYGAAGKESENDNKEVKTAMSSSYRMAKFNKKGIIEPEYKVGYLDRSLNTQLLPIIRPYLELDNGDRVMYMDLVNKNKGNKNPFNSEYTILGLKESILTLNDQKVRFKFIHEQVPVEKWNFHYFYGQDGDKRKLDNETLIEIAESVVNNPDTEYTKYKMSDSQTVNHGFKWGSLLEPIHQKLSEATVNYNLYTPSIAELPKVNEYISTLLIPFLKILMILAGVVAIVQYMRNIKSMGFMQLLFTLGIVIFANFAITSLYPAILNTGFNNLVPNIMGTEGYNLTLYNIEKDLNSKGEFIYTDKPSKIMSRGSYIKLGNLSGDEVKRYRSAEEDAPWKNTDYYIPKWDMNPLKLGNQTFIKGNTLNMYVKDLTSSAQVIYREGKYEVVWDNLPEYTYYIPYLSILEGLTKSVNNFTEGRITPKVLEYYNGYRGENGGALSYFSNEVFLVDNATARKQEGEFKESWDKVNGGDFLNLNNVLDIEKDDNRFPDKYKFRTKTTRWYKTAVQGRTNDQIQRKIIDVNLKTKRYAMELLPFMDNITDDIALKMISLYATVEFNKEFSHSPTSNLYHIRDFMANKIQGSPDEDYFTTIYPKRLHLDSISIDEQLKLSLINVSDLLKFNITSLFKFVENKSSWAGMFLLSLNSGLLMIRSLMRIVFITFILCVILMYMMIVYALRRDYTNKTIFGMLGIIISSWGIYLADNLVLLLFSSLDKQSAGLMMMMLIMWLLWNIAATVAYIVLFTTVVKDIGSFGGNIFYSAASTVLEKANIVAKAGIRLVSKNRADSFDITRPDWSQKADNFGKYLDQDIDIKMAEQQHNLENGLKEVGQNLMDKYPKASSIKDIYAENMDSPENTLKMRILPNTAKSTVEYLEDNGLMVDKNKYNMYYEVGGLKEDWARVIEENKVKTDAFDGLFKESNGSFYAPKTNFITDYLNKAGVPYETKGKTIEVARKGYQGLNQIEETLKQEIYKVDVDKEEALNKLQGTVSPNEYEIGRNGVYMKNKNLAKEMFGVEPERMYKTRKKIDDRVDKTESGSYISPNIDFMNGAMITGEYVYGKINMEAFKTLTKAGTSFVPMGKETYKFDRENREEIMEAIEKSARYTETDKGITFTKKADIDKTLAWGDENFNISFNEKEEEEQIEIPTEQGETQTPIEEAKTEDLKDELIIDDDFDLDL